MTNAYIAPNELVDGKVYRLNSRNLSIGVYNSEHKGFVGIRTKFGSRFLDEEIEWDADTHYGTARALECIGEISRPAKGWVVYSREDGYDELYKALKAFESSV